jgi:nucleoside-diphosphate-sugar epimerase
MSNQNSRILLIGATGQIGSELVLALREKYGCDNVIAAGHVRKPTSKILNSGPFVTLDVTKGKEIVEIVKKHKVNTIYHLAAVLSAVGEKNPRIAWDVNLGGLYNILEVARKYEISKIFWPSSIAVFGPETPRINTPQETIMIPRTMYGVAKVSGELLCNYYFNRFGLDIRSVRYPGIISSETLPGGGTTDYAVEIFYEAIKNKRYECFVRKDTVLPLMYMPDCINAAIKIMETPSNQIKCRTSYNLASMSFSAEELALEIKKEIPDFKCIYKPDSRQKIADSWPSTIDDNLARKDWNWIPEYNLKSMVKDMITKLSKRFQKNS